MGLHKHTIIASIIPVLAKGPRADCQEDEGGKKRGNLYNPLLLIGLIYCRSRKEAQTSGKTSTREVGLGNKLSLIAVIKSWTPWATRIVFPGAW